jgi:hypothetical protein
MLLAFLTTVLSGTQLAAMGMVGVGVMLLGQAALGLAMGMIYSGSLYFGMVLSEGSTEHGGYHESLIGLGNTLGPGVGFITQYLRPGDLNLGIMAVSGVILLTVIAAGIAAVRAKAAERESD